MPRPRPSQPGVAHPSSMRHLARPRTPGPRRCRYPAAVRVAEVMSDASVTDAPSDTLKAAASRMWSQQTGSLLVMDGERLVGIVTERDVMKAVARGLPVDSTPVSTIMTTNVLTVTPETPLHEAAEHMARRWIRHLPVVEGERVVGMVSQRDLVGVLASSGENVDQQAGEDLVRARRLARLDRGDLG